MESNGNRLPHSMLKPMEWLSQEIFNKVLFFYSVLGVSRVSSFWAQSERETRCEKSRGIVCRILQSIGWLSLESEQTFPVFGG